MKHLLPAGTETTRLVLEAQAGDGDARERLVRRLTPYVTAMVRKCAGPRTRRDRGWEEADLVQEVWAQLHLERFRYTGHRSFVRYLRRVTKNRLREIERHLSRTRRATPREAQREGSGCPESVEKLHIAHPGTSPSQHAVRMDLETTAREVLSPEEFRVWWSFRRQAVPIRQISEALGKSTDTVRRILQRAEITLTKLMDSGRTE